MVVKSRKQIRGKKQSPAKVAKSRNRPERLERELNLRAIRELAGRTQEEVADGVKISQAQISRTESKADPRLSFLLRYVKALGGDLELYARVGKNKVRLY